MCPECETNEKGNKIAEKIWFWLKEQQSISYVPWVRDPDGKQYDIAKAAIQKERDHILAELERLIMDLSQSR